MLNRFLSVLMFVCGRHCICWGFPCSLLAITNVVCQSLRRVRLFETPWTVARQAPLSMELSRQEYWSG